VLFLGIYPTVILNLQSPALERLTKQVIEASPPEPAAAAIAAR